MVEETILDLPISGESCRAWMDSWSLEYRYHNNIIIIIIILFDLIKKLFYFSSPHFSPNL